MSATYKLNRDVAYGCRFTTREQAESVMRRLPAQETAWCLKKVDDEHWLVGRLPFENAYELDLEYLQTPFVLMADGSQVEGEIKIDVGG